MSDNNNRHMNDSTMPPPKASAVAKKVNPRARNNSNTPKKGFGLADWTRLLKSSKNLAQNTNGIRRDITREEVLQHNQPYDAWMILHGKVYNIGPYLHYHPGGLSILKSSLGKDVSTLFDKYHRWVHIDGLIGPLLLGYLDVTPRSKDSQETTSYLPKASNDGFAMPAPRPPTKMALPRLLPNSKSDDESEEEDMN